MNKLTFARMMDGSYYNDTYNLRIVRNWGKHYDSPAASWTLRYDGGRTIGTYELLRHARKYAARHLDAISQELRDHER